MALSLLSDIVDESQLDLLHLDAEMLEFFLNKIQGALAAGKTVHEGCMSSEMLRGLSLLAKNDFNRRLMVAQGNCRISCEYLHLELVIGLSPHLSKVFSRF